ncbi:hypothetical protein QEN19_001895 [Hanseniaspora menglaensis]
MVLSMKSIVAMAACASAVAAAPAIEFDLKKHIGTINSKSIVSKDGSGILSFDLLNQQGFFSVNVEIGTPAQSPVVLLIDTGSSDMWVNGVEACLPGTFSNSTVSNKVQKKRYASSVLEGFELTATYASTYFNAVSSDFIEPSATATAVSVETGIDCSEYGAFSTGLSSSWKELNLGEPFGIEYVDLSQAHGVYGTDSLSINGISVPNTTFAVATFSNSSQGVLGISLPRDESLFSNYDNGTTYANLPQQLKADGLISKVSYSLFLNSLCDQSGSLLFGAINNNWYTGELNTVPLVNIYPSFTDIPLEFDITVNGVGIADYPTLGSKKTLTKTNFPGVLDSGTTLMQLPPDLAYALADSLDFVFDDAFGWFVGGCPTADQLRESSIVFNIGGINYYAPLNNFIYTTSSPDVCAFVVSPFVSNGDFEDADDYSKYNNYAILGDVLLTSLVAVYDLESYEITLGVANYEGYAAGDGEVEQIVSTVPGAKKAPGYSNTWSTWEYITHYAGDESDGIFTDANEVNPWLATASFGCGLDTTSTTSSATSSVTATSNSANSSVTATSNSATSSFTTTANSTTAFPASSTYTSVTQTSKASLSTSSSSSETVLSSSDPLSLSIKPASSIPSENLVSTISEDKTTLVTITSCKDNACSLTVSPALVSTATSTIEGTVTEFTTYCPLTGESTNLSTSVITTATSDDEQYSAETTTSTSSGLNVTTETSSIISGTSSSSSTQSVISTEANGVSKISGSLIGLAAALLAAF